MLINLTTPTKRSLALATLMLAGFALAGCAPTAETPAPDAEVVVPTASDVWIKAVPGLMDGMAMTALFGVMENSSDEDITILGGTADPALTLTPLEAHEMATTSAGEMVMRVVDGGIVIPANGSVSLTAGGYHVMFLDLLKPIAVGSDVVATLNFSNGTSLKVTAVAREIANAQESYDPNSEVDMSMDMDMNMDMDMDMNMDME